MISILIGSAMTLKIDCEKAKTNKLTARGLRCHLQQ